MTLEEFEPWSGAIGTLDRIKSLNLMGEFEYFLEVLCDGAGLVMDETSLNDLLWHESEWIYESLGIGCDAD
jgi:hypothetical protein